MTRSPMLPACAPGLVVLWGVELCPQSGFGDSSSKKWRTLWQKVTQCVSICRVEGLDQGEVPMLVVIVGVLLTAAAVLWLNNHRQADKQLRLAQEQSFSQLRFPTYGQRLTGAEVTVIRRDQCPPPAPVLPAAQAAAQASWWYCVGPRRTCYMAVALCERQWLRWQVRWVVRPLDEQHMRQALDGDAEALWLAFGEVGERGLQL